MKPPRYGVSPARRQKCFSQTVSGHGSPGRFTAATGTSMTRYHFINRGLSAASGAPTMMNTASSPCASAIAIASNHAPTTSHYCDVLGR